MLYFDKSALFRTDSISGIYCGFAEPTCTKALMHCLAVIGFSSVTWVRKSDMIASKRFWLSHRAFAARIYRTRFRTNDFGWSSNDAKSSKCLYHSLVCWLSNIILSATAQARLSSFAVSISAIFSIFVSLTPKMPMYRLSDLYLPVEGVVKRSDFY